MEIASGSRVRRKQRSIEYVPEFRDHLERNGLKSLAEWEQKNHKTLDGFDELDLRRRKLKLSFK